jgi:5-methylthioribose kinase
MPLHLDAADPAGIADVLDRLGLLPSPVARVASAGEGNMNLTLRVTFEDGASRIVKQARPWVEKYPSIAAPDERALVEAAFYQALTGTSVAERMPTLLGVLPDARIQVFEDLGESRDYTDLYAGEALATDDLRVLLQWLSELHELEPPTDARLANRAMRALNHAHIFEIPFQADNGLDLDGICPGLSAIAREVQADDALLGVVARFGRRYLSDGTSLLHGDFYPGSFLRTERGPVVIDPEFAFVGDRAFDWGVFGGHLVLAQQAHPLIHKHFALGPTEALVYAGIEILRRLLGVAQLPLQADLEARREMVRIARDWILQ